jgi:hypothetical protein
VAKARIPHFTVAGGGLIALLVAGGYLYLFRSTKIDMGIWAYEYRREWGSVQEKQIDLNRDGVYDYVGRYKGYSLDRSAHDPLVSAMASSRCDGVFDVKINYDDGRPLSLEFDADGDGVSELHEPLEGYQWMARKCKAWELWIGGRTE